MTKVAVRKGYTLLEVMLAIAIGLLLLAALYVAFDVQFRYMQTGRDLAAEGQLARGLLNRIGADIRSSLAALPANQTGQAGATGQSAQSGSATSDTEESSSQATTGQFNLGVLGDDRQITLFASILPRYAQEEADLETGGVSDQRRITYYLVEGQGLARQEVRNVMALELSPEDERVDLLANEVVDLTFRYYDPQQGWVETWDGTTKGPPLAVEIQIAFQPPAETRTGGRPKPLSYYKMVVAIPGGNFTAAPTSGTTAGGTP